LHLDHCIHRYINSLITTLPHPIKNETIYFIIAHSGDRCMNKPEFKHQYQTGVNHSVRRKDVESKMTVVGQLLAVFIKQKWRRGLITAELNFNILSISSSVLIRTLKMTLSHKL
ncbi:hypothetical protein T07_3181, partial [Trichinella nelsoni]